MQQLKVDSAYESQGLAVLSLSIRWLRLVTVDSVHCTYAAGWLQMSCRPVLQSVPVAFLCSCQNRLEVVEHNESCQVPAGSFHSPGSVLFFHLKVLQLRHRGQGLVSNEIKQLLSCSAAQRRSRTRTALLRSLASCLSCMSNHVSMQRHQFCQMPRRKFTSVTAWLVNEVSLFLFTNIGQVTPGSTFRTASSTVHCPTTRIACRLKGQRCHSMLCQLMVTGMANHANDGYTLRLDHAISRLQEGDPAEADLLSDDTVDLLTSPATSTAVCGTLMAAVHGAQPVWEDFVPLYLLPKLCKAAVADPGLLEVLATLVQMASVLCPPRDLAVILLAEWAILSERCR